jgi:hypothetical protein
MEARQKGSKKRRERREPVIRAFLFDPLGNKGKRSKLPQWSSGV